MASTVTELMMRRFGGKPKEDIYKDTVCFEFELNQASQLSVTQNYNEVTTYLDALIIDGSEVSFVKGMTYSFTIGKHKIGWRMKDVTTVKKQVIGGVKTSSNNSIFVAGSPTLIIPSCVTSIDSLAMRGNPCYGISKAYVYPTTPPTVGLAGIALWYASANNPIYVSSQSVNDYKAADQWSSYSAAITAMT